MSTHRLRGESRGSSSPLVLLAALTLAAAGCGRDEAPTPAAPAVAPSEQAPPPEAPAQDAEASPAGEAPEQPEAKVSKGWVSELTSEARFDALSRELGGERFLQWTVPLEGDSVYYFDARVFALHIDFHFAVFEGGKRTKEARDRFRRNYGRDKPDFLLGDLVHHADQGVWAFAFYEGDLMTPEHVRMAYRRLKKTCFCGDQLKWRPDSTLHEAMIPQLPDVPTVLDSQLYADASYRAFNVAQRVGVLRIVSPEEAAADPSFRRDEIVLLTEPLPDITVVAGIISERFSSPLAHVFLRGRAWGIPMAGIKGAAARFRDLAGKTVYFAARAGGYELREATVEEKAGLDAQVRPTRRTLLPAADLETRELRKLDEIGAEDVETYGAKTANLGEVAHAGIAGIDVPAGYGIPISWYRDHLKRAGLDAKVAALLADSRIGEDAAYRKAQLRALREAIVKAPMDPAQIAELARVCRELGIGPERGLFVRSSTNAEDLEGFSGAGLYDTIPNVRDPAAVPEAVKKVWASVWNLRAYEEREYFGVDHAGVYGAVLLQIGVQPTAAGVMITANLHNPEDDEWFTINAKWGLGIRVVEGRKIPEQLMVDPTSGEIKVIARSDEETMLVFDPAGGVREVPTPGAGAPILSDALALKLAHVGEEITGLFDADAQDIEWLVADGRIQIVQARPYTTPQAVAPIGATIED